MFGSLRQRGGTIVVAAIVGAVAAGSPAVAAEVVAFAKSAGNANTVNKIGASKTPRAGMLVPLNAKGQFPAAVIPASRQAIGQAGPAGPQGGRRAQQGRTELPGAQGPKGNTEPTGANRGPDKGRSGADGAVYPALIDVNPIPRASASHNWDAFIVNGGIAEQRLSLVAHQRRRDELPRVAATARGRNWSMEVTYVKADDAGIMTFSLDGSRHRIGRRLRPGGRAKRIGQTVSAITVGTSGMHTLRVRTDAKNAASSNYFGYLVWLRLVKQ